jgi:Meckel syndrome type 1 protein
MTHPLPPIEALDENERELARIVRALPGGDPPPALDARILKAAANAAAGSRRPRSRWLASTGAMWGIGGAAAAVLAFGVSWHSMFPAQRSAGGRSNPVAVSAESSQDSTVSVEFKDRQAPQFDNAPPPSTLTGPAPARPTRAPASVATAPTAAASPAPARAPEPFSADHIDEHVPSRAMAGASARAEIDGYLSAQSAGNAATPAFAEPSAASAKAVAAQAQTQTLDQAAAVAEKSEGRAGQTSGQLGDQMKPLRLKPSNWLVQIRQLRDQNRIAEARTSLVAFHKRYPSVVIPSDLAPLLRE